MALQFEITNCILALLMIISGVNSYNILFATVFSSKSHKLAMDPIAEELAKRGHKLTVISITKETKVQPGIREVLIREAMEITHSRPFDFFTGTMVDTDFIAHLHDFVYALTEAMYRDPFIQDIVQNPRDPKTGAPQYDVLVVDAIYNEFTLPLAYHMKIPTVYVSPSIVYPQIKWLLNVPNPFCYSPSLLMFLPGQMSFLQRIQSAYSDLEFIYTRLYVSYPIEDELTRKYLPNTPPIMELEANVSLVITNNHPALTPSVPTMPYYLDVGGLHLKQAKKLDSKLEEFMQNSGDEGVIYFSLGSITQGKTMPDELRQKLIKGFSQLKEKILWKNDRQLEGLSPNVKIISWAPQSDLLAHPKLKLFITHGGGLSIQEAAYNGCPLLGFPLSADQQSNMANVINAGFGESLDWRTVRVDEFVQTIKKITEDSSYKENAMRLMALLRDRPEEPVKTAAYWIEFVIRHKGAPHLKSEADKFNFFQYFLLDIILTIFITIVAILAFIGFVLKKLACYLMAYNQQKTKKH